MPASSLLLLLPLEAVSGAGEQDAAKSAASDAAASPLDEHGVLLLSLTSTAALLSLIARSCGCGKVRYFDLRLYAHLLSICHVHLW